MRVSLVTVTALTTVVSAAPLNPSPSSLDKGLISYSDIYLLQFSLYLSNFQSAFYRQGLSNFSASSFEASNFSSSLHPHLLTIASQSTTHVSSLTSTLRSLNASTIHECTYNFNVTTPGQFITTASLIQGASVSALLGSIKSYKSPELQTLAASTLAVEARHSSYIRGALGLPEFASPFETPLSLNEAYTLAELFTPECPESNPVLPFQTLPLGSGKAPENSTLSSSFSNHGVVGGVVMLLTFGYDVHPATDSNTSQIYAAFLTLTGPVFTPATPVPGLGFNVTVPEAPAGYAPIAGFTYVVLTSKKMGTLRDEDVLAGPASLEINAE